MENRQPPAPDAPETILDPEAIAQTRRIIASLTEWTDNGEVEAVSVYVQLRAGGYRNMQTDTTTNRHEDAGRIMELLLLRLGFTQRQEVETMIEEGR